MRTELTRGEKLFRVGGMRTEKDTNMVNELRNYHVKKLLNHLGGETVPPYLQKAIKRSFSEFTEDITKQEDTYGHERTSDDAGNR